MQNLVRAPDHPSTRGPGKLPTFADRRSGVLMAPFRIHIYTFYLTPGY